jgi:DNA-binding response OmpR family regulator
MNKKFKVLVVEDELPLAMMMVHLLTHAGCDVEMAPTGRKGLELAQKIQFDLITLDIDLPDANGFEICRQLKERQIYRDIPVVMISGRPLEENMKQTMEVGAVDYISKPFDVTEYIFRIISHLNAAAAASDVSNEDWDADSKNLPTSLLTGRWNQLSPVAALA